MQAAEPDDPQDAVVAQQVSCYYGSNFQSPEDLSIYNPVEFSHTYHIVD